MGSIRSAFLKQTCARLGWARARARQARPPRLRLFSFPVRPPGGERPRASDESLRDGAMSKGVQPRALRQSLQKSFATRSTPGRGDFSLEISVKSRSLAADPTSPRRKSLDQIYTN